MQRREFLRATGGIAATGSLAGCSALSGGSSTDTTTPRTNRQPKQGPQADPSAKWSEDWLGGARYRLTVTVQLNGAQQVQIRTGTDTVVTTITESGTHIVAGPDTDRGPAERGRMYTVYLPSGNVGQLVTSHTVGTQDEASFPLFLNGVHGSTDPTLKHSDLIHRTYTQSVGATATEYTISIPTVLSEYYSSRHRTRNYGAYVSDTYDDQYLDSLVQDFKAYGNRHGLSDPGIINHMLAFVQDLEYSRDKVATGYDEYPKYPVETLVDKGGDCEDTCILLASLLEQFGYGSVLLAYFDAGHMALGIAGSDDLPGTYVEYEGTRYYYTETTVPGWDVGEAPPDIRDNDPQVLEINSHPVLVFSYAVQVSTTGGVTVEGTMQNVGDAIARTAQLQVEFQNPQQETLAKQTSGETVIRPMESKTVALDLFPPGDMKQRVKVSVLLDGELHDATTSGYKAPLEQPG